MLKIKKGESLTVMYIWQDYIPEDMEYVEKWLDKEAIRLTGLDDGWRGFFDYWKNDAVCTLGENFWCKVVFEGKNPFAVIAFGLWEGSVHIMEVLVAPKFRKQGRGTGLLKELLENGERIFDCSVEKAEAVIFPDNPASQKAFEKVGFVFDHAHEDGDAWYYIFQKNR